MSDGLYRIGGEEAGRRAPDRAVIRLRRYVRDDGVGHLILLSTDSLTPERDLADAALNALYRTGRLTDAERGALTDPRMFARWEAAERNEPLDPGRRVGGDEAADLVCLGFSRAWRDGAARGEPGSTIYLPESDAGEPGLAEAAARVQEIFRAVSAGLIGRGDGQVRQFVFRSVYAPHPEETLAHEVIHALRQTGRLAPEERAAVTDPRLAARWRERYGVDRLYGELSPDLRLEEPCAARFAEAWREAAAAGAGAGLGMRLAETGGPDPEIAAAAGRVRHLALLNVYSNNPDEDLAHEVIHALRRTGRFGDGEWDVLTHPRLVERWHQRFATPGLYGAEGSVDQVEESVAASLARAWREAAAAGAGGELGLRLAASQDPDPEIAAAARRAEAVFRAVASGGIGARPEDPEAVRGALRRERGRRHGTFGRSGAGPSGGHRRDRRRVPGGLRRAGWARAGDHSAERLQSRRHRGDPCP